MNAPERIWGILGKDSESPHWLGQFWSAPCSEDDVCFIAESEVDRQLAELEARADRAEGLLAEAVEALRDARHNGLIYWEPNTSRGHETRAAMCARIDATLARIKEAGNG